MTTSSLDKALHKQTVRFLDHNCTINRKYKVIYYEIFRKQSIQFMNLFTLTRERRMATSPAKAIVFLVGK